VCEDGRTRVSPRSVRLLLLLHRNRAGRGASAAASARVATAAARRRQPWGAVLAFARAGPGGAPSAAAADGGSGRAHILSNASTRDPGRSGTPGCEPRAKGTGVRLPAGRACAWRGCPCVCSAAWSRQVRALPRGGRRVRSPWRVGGAVGPDGSARSGGHVALLMRLRRPRPVIAVLRPGVALTRGVAQRTRSAAGEQGQAGTQCPNGGCSAGRAAL